MSITEQIVGLDPNDFGFSASVKLVQIPGENPEDPPTYKRVREITWYTVGVDSEGNRVRQHRETKLLEDLPSNPKTWIKSLGSMVWQDGLNWVDEQQVEPDYDDE